MYDVFWIFGAVAKTGCAYAFLYKQASRMATILRGYTSKPL